MRRYNFLRMIVMKSNKIISVFLSVLMITSAVSFSSFSNTSAAKSASQVQNEINELEKQSQQLEKQISSLSKQKNNQQAVVSAIQKKMNVVESQIIACNKQISSINSKIDANKAQIDEKNKEIENDKLTFKKRLRASYMSNTDSNIKVLFGAQSFAEYLQLSQLMKAVSSHDKALMDKLEAAIKELRDKNTENEKLLNDQVALKNTIAEKQKELEADRAKEQNTLNSISSQQSTTVKQNKELESQIKERQNYLLNLNSNVNIVLDAERFIWPVPGKYGVSNQYAGHTGVDLSSGGIAGAPVVAMADGVVVGAQGGWTSSMGTYGMASYGNYVTIDHGRTPTGNTYITLYAHMVKIAVSNGAHVKQGQVIGYVGTTGNSTGYHLHVEVKRNNSRIYGSQLLAYVRGQIKL